MGACADQRFEIVLSCAFGKDVPDTLGLLELHT